jgi:hypothetical protein
MQLLIIKEGLTAQRFSHFLKVPVHDRKVGYGLSVINSIKRNIVYAVCKAKYSLTLIEEGLGRHILL